MVCFFPEVSLISMPESFFRDNIVYAFFNIFHNINKAYILYQNSRLIIFDFLVIFFEKYNS